MNISMDSMETSQSLISFNDEVDNKTDLQTGFTVKETDREGYCAGNEEDDTDDDEHRTREQSGIEISTPTNSPKNLSVNSDATTIPKREGSLNYRKTLRLSSEQIVRKIYISTPNIYIKKNTRTKSFL